MNDKLMVTDHQDKIENINNDSTNNSDQSNSTIDINNPAPVTRKTKKKFRFKIPIIIILIILAIICVFIFSDYYSNKSNSIVLCKKAVALAKDKFPNFEITGTSYRPASHGMDSSWDASCSASIVKKSGNKFETYVSTDEGYNYIASNSYGEFTIQDTYNKYINYGNFSTEAKNNLIEVVDKYTGDKNVAYAYTSPDNIVITQISKSTSTDSYRTQAVRTDMSENKTRENKNYFFISKKSYEDIYYLNNNRWIFVKTVS